MWEKPVQDHGTILSIKKLNIKELMKEIIKYLSYQRA